MTRYEVRFLRDLQEADAFGRIQSRNVDRSMAITLPHSGYGMRIPPASGYQEPDVFDPENYHVAQPRVFFLKGVDLHSRFGLLSLGQTIIAESARLFPWWMFPEFTLEGELGSQAYIVLPNRRNAADISLAYSTHYGLHSNYYHWNILLLGRISTSLIECWRDQTGMAPVVLYPSFTDDTQRQAAEILSRHHGTPYLAVDNGVPLHISTLVLPEYGSRGVHPHPLVREPFEVLRGCLYEADCDYPEKLYLSRRDSPNRRLTNEEAVEEHLRRAGYRAVTMTGRSLKEQVNFFAHAKRIIAPHGAGATNIIYCEPGTKFLEIHMPSYANWCFRRLAAACGIAYGFLFGQLSSDGHRYFQHRSYSLDLTLLDEVLETGF